MKQQFLFLPFKRHKYKITEGWNYSEEDLAIHGHKGHGAIDFELPRGAEVLAAADGWAIASYATSPIKDQSGKQKMYKGKPVSYGFGRLVQIYHPQNDFFTAYGHLEGYGPRIKFHRPVKKGEKYISVGHKVRPDKLKSYQFVVRVKKGEVIGFVGDSGLTWGYDDYPNRPDPDKFPSWAKTHIHFEVFKRVGSNRKKKYYDPFGIKSTLKDYPDSFKKGKALGEKSEIFWVLDQKGRLQYAND